MSDIYHIICANDEDAHKTLQQIKTPAAEKFVAPSFHPSIPAYVVVIDPEDPSELLALGELVSTEHRTAEIEEETYNEPSRPQDFETLDLVERIGDEDHDE